MRQFIFVACALLASAGLAWAGSPTNPDWVRQQQGTTLSTVYVACGSTGEGTALLTTTDTADARKLTFINGNATNDVTLCPSAVECDGLADGVHIQEGNTLIVSASAQGSAWRCLGDGATVGVFVLIEK